MQCLTVTPSHCMEPHLFNNETCACACDTSLYKRDKMQCEAYSDRKWDPVTCSCRQANEIIHFQQNQPGNKDGKSGNDHTYKDKNKEKQAWNF